MTVRANRMLRALVVAVAIDHPTTQPVQAAAPAGPSFTEVRSGCRFLSCLAH